MNVVIITGASSGIGREFALQLDAGLYTVDEFWLIARREERLEMCIRDRPKDISGIYDGIILPSYEDMKEDKKKYAESFMVQYSNTDPFNGN